MRPRKGRAKPDARRAFLDELLGALGPGWSAEHLPTFRPLGVPAMRLRAEGVRGKVDVVPSVVRDGVISWDPFPGKGRPHWDLHADDDHLQRTCVLASAVSLLDGWRRSRLPLERGAPSPVLEEVRPVLAAIAAGRRAEPVVLVRAAVPRKLAPTPEGERQLRAALAALDPVALAASFPREDDGRIPLDADVLLAPIASRARLSQGRGVWLCASSPPRRSAGPEVTLGLRDVRPDNATHRWDAAPHLWRRGARAPALRDRRRALACVAQLDAGAFDEALAQYGIRVSEHVQRVLEGRPLTAYDSALAPRWRMALRRALWECAPWQLARVPPTRATRLVLLPGQRHQRKVWLVWTPAGLDLERTAANERLPAVLWKRSLEFDRARLGLRRG